MVRGVRRFVLGSVSLAAAGALAGCGGWFFAEREPWRRDAEVACLATGAVKEGPGKVHIAAITGPGICGADYPFKISILGESAPLGYGDEPRPPSAIAGSHMPRWPIAAPAPAETRDDPRYDISPEPYDHRRIMEPSIQRGGVSPEYRTAAGGVSVVPSATLACPLAAALDQWIANSVQPAALRWFGQPVVEIKQISSYSCRGMNGNPNARISEHAFGNALDIAAFTLADGRKVVVRTGWNGAPAEQGFLRDVEGAACEQFTTVLAPGSNAYHYDHMHVDLMRRNGGRRACNPHPVSGDEVAARAAARIRAAGGRLPTGSIPSPARTMTPRSYSDVRAGLPAATAGEDGEDD